MKTTQYLQAVIIFALLLLGLLGVRGAQQASAQSGATPPIVVIVNDSAANKFGRYLGEILRAEGLNSFDVASIGSLNASTLSLYRVALLAETSLTSTQATMLTNYVGSGGYLIAMRADAQMSWLLGLSTGVG